MSSVVLDNGSIVGPNTSTLTANGALLGSGGVVSAGAGVVRNSLTLVGSPVVPNAPGPAQNQLLLNGAYLRVDANTFTAPQTAVSTATLQIIDAATPQLQLAMNQTAPLLNAGGQCFTAYATANTALANSVLVGRTSVQSFPETQPAGSLAGVSGTGAFAGVAAHTQVAAADAIACPTITANSAVRCWLAGLTGTVGATAVAAATASAIVPGTGFTLNGTIGAIYGYEVLYA
jgi:hypothetical protein